MLGRVGGHGVGSYPMSYGQRVIRGLDHAQLAAPPGCEAAARAFFGDELGLVEIPKPAALLPQGGVWFALADGRELHIGVETPFTPQEKAHLAFAIDGADALAVLAARFGASIDRVTIPGAARFNAADPWGNRLEFIARI
jgi:catechol 2,3-dioxygenase-like lactoylglutathione lyase family enzyme